MMCADRDLCRRVRGLLPEWNISVFAEEVGKEIFTWSGRMEYLRRSEETVRVHRNRMAEKMAVKGIRYIESSCNFVLFESDAGLYERMLLQRTRGKLVQSGCFRGFRVYCFFAFALIKSYL